MKDKPNMSLLITLGGAIVLVYVATTYISGLFGAGVGAFFAWYCGYIYETGILR